MRTALTIAGSDSGGGAGIQADLKSFAAVGVHGTSVITCVTAQNTRAVDSIFPLPPQEVRAQMRAVLEDFDVRAAKTGMLYSADIVGTVAEELAGTGFSLVVDPVMVATVGASLEKDDFRDALVARLLPRASLVTPNRHEAERLSGFAIRSVLDAERAARAIRELGPEAVLVKGGHLEGRLVDVFLDGGGIRRLGGHRYRKNLHGAGCTLAASIAGYLALGESLFDAVRSARRRVAAGFATSYRAGMGVEVINSHFVPDRFALLEATEDVAARLGRILPAWAVPEEGADVTYGLPSATSARDAATAAIRRGKRARVGPPPAAFGMEGEGTFAVLAAVRRDPQMRSAITFKYPQKNARPPPSTLRVVAIPGRPSVPKQPAWRGRAARAIVEAGTVPDVVCEKGMARRDGRIWVFGKDPEDAFRKVRRVLRTWGP